MRAIEVHHCYPGGVAALEGVSLDVEPGTMTAIIGPNGAGKTTLIKCLAGLLAPARGEVKLADRSLHELAPRERACTIAYVPQAAAIPFPFTVLEVVLMGRAPHRKSLQFEGEGDLRIARAAMEETEVEGFAGRCIHELSGGEMQRVILARALAQEAQLMLLDEPTASLDLKHTVALYRVLKERCCARSLAVVAAMHDINLASLFCDRIVLLAAGRVVASGTPAEVVSEDVLASAFDTPVTVCQDVKKGYNLVIPRIREI